MKAIRWICWLIAFTFVCWHAIAQEQSRLSTPLGLDEYFQIPEDNPLTPERIELGRKLFFDPRLSADHTISCASCHKPELAFSDGQTISAGVGNRKGERHTPALVNLAYGKSFFWDGRVATLEEQVLHPIQNPVEMNLTLEELNARLKRDVSYIAEFHRAFTDRLDANDDGVNSNNIVRALASFIRTLRFGNSPFDRFQSGDRTALSAEARRGLNLFRGKANCVACHVGPNFTDGQFHNTGVAVKSGDLGRYAVTGDEKDRGAFKTPTLREVARTAPYMHDGTRATLEEVVEFYNRGGNRNTNLDPELRPLRLTQDEKAALVAFLKSLTGASTLTNPR